MHLDRYVSISTVKTWDLVLVCLLVASIALLAPALGRIKVGKSARLPLAPEKSQHKMCIILTAVKG